MSKKQVLTELMASERVRQHNLYPLTVRSPIPPFSASMSWDGIIHG